MARRQIRKTCCVPACVNTEINESLPKKKIAYFQLPRDAAKRQEWLRLMLREDVSEYSPDVKHYNVCQEHFSKDSFIPTRYKALKADALPSLCIPQTQVKREDVSTVSISTQTTDTIPPEMNIAPSTFRKRKYKRDSSVDPKTDFDGFIKKFAPFELDRIYRTREIIIKKNKENSFDDNYKLFCLNLYYASPQTYIMSENLLEIPKIMCIHKDIPVTTEINKNFINTLQLKIINMTDVERHCLVLIDNMTIAPCYKYDDEEEKIIGFQEINGVQSTTSAVKALVAIVHGMFTEWSQPVGYALLSEHTNINIVDWINELLEKMCKVGLYIHVINFTNAAESDFYERSWVSVDDPYFFINNRKIFYINDPRLLLTLLRDCLLVNDICFEGRQAKYKYIIQFYKEDKNKDFRLAPQLTNSHIYPTDFDKTNTTYVIELLSKSVACGLSAYIDAKKIEEEGRDTVELITRINKLCDFVNYAKKRDKRIYYSDESKRFLKEMMDFMQNLKFIDSTSGQDVTSSWGKLILSFQITINAMIHLLEVMVLVDTKKSLPMRTSNQGITNKFFMKIRKSCGYKTETNTDEFVSTFKKLVIDHMVKPMKGRNMPKYHRKFLTQLNKVILPQNDAEALKKNNDVLGEIELNIERKICIPDSDYRHIDSTEKHSLIYVSSFLLNKCNQLHGYCKSLSYYMSGVGGFISPENISRYLEYSERHRVRLPCVPCNDFVQIVEQMEEKFCQIFKRCVNYKIEHKLFLEIKKMCLKLPCRCFPGNYLFKLFIRIRIAYTIQLNNKANLLKPKSFVIPLLLST